MRITLDKLMERLGVGHVLAAYETRPWLHYDEASGTTFSAEVRMGPGAEDLEAEIQLLKDEGGGEKDEEETEVGETGEGADGYQPKQIMLMRAVPVKDGHWSPVALKIKGEDYVNKIYDWEGKSCDFFRLCIEAVQMGEMPNIDELIARELKDDDDTDGGKRGRVGRKAPKVNPAALMGLGKRGM